MNAPVCHCPTCGSPLPHDLFVIDREAFIIVADGRFSHLSPQEFAVFITLYDKPARVHSKEALLTAISPAIDDEPEIKIVDVYVCKLRKKLAGMGVGIETVWGQGYRIIPRGRI